MERIRIDIPFTDLRSKPIVVHIQGVVATVRLNPQAEQGAQRSAKLAKHEAAWKAAGEVNEEEDAAEEESSGEKTGGIRQKIIENIEVTIENLHLRFEVSLSLSLSLSLSDSLTL